jgi:hypothetical protein
MRKSVLAMAAVAAMGAAGAANAGYWTLSGMNYQNGGNITIGSGNSTMQNGSYGGIAVGSAGTFTNDSATTSAAMTALGVSLVDDTLTYFGFDQAATGPGSFGVALKATAAITLTVSGGPAAGQGSNGVIASQAATGAPAFIGGGFLGEFSVAAGDTLVIFFGGFAAGNGFTLDVTRSAGAANFGVSYLTYNGTSFVQYASAAAATKSGLNTALYAIPVPAPVLLAGAGLIGAAALRRRMVKKG